MAVSVFDLFKIGIGPSSSHTVGPMRAARLFVRCAWCTTACWQRTARVQSQLYGSWAPPARAMAATRRCCWAWPGLSPTRWTSTPCPRCWPTCASRAALTPAGQHDVAFAEKDDLKFHRRETLPFHANGMRFTAFDAAGSELTNAAYYSVGGGFVVSDEVAADGARHKVIAPDTTALPLPFHSGAELLQRTREIGGSIADVMRRNEGHVAQRRRDRRRLLRIWR
jgi:L-serine dehydratase